MHLMSYRGFEADVIRDTERGAFIATLRGVPDPVRFRATSMAELPERMAHTVDDYIARRQEWGLTCGRPFMADRRVRFGAVRKTA